MSQRARSLNSDGGCAALIHPTTEAGVSLRRVDKRSASTSPLKSTQNWPDAALDALRETPSVVRILVASLRGSAPREAGACMLVTRDGIIGTIGGGHLEWKAIAAARLLLPQTAPPAHLQRYVLGIELGQCCGGVVELWMERLYGGGSSVTPITCRCDARNIFDSAGHRI